MKKLTILSLSLFLCMHMQSQVISGKLLDATTNLPIEYASIGVIGTPLGTITDEKGDFNLEVKTLASNATVRISMIGYKAQSFTVEQLLNKENMIKLTVEAIQIKEVVVRPGGKLKKVGTKDYVKSLGCCGWGGDGFGKGHEIGTRINLGTLPVRLQSLHLLLLKQSFDSSQFRLHIRNIVNDLPNNELLNRNIYVVATKKSGWIDVDLSQYNLVFEGEIAVTIEWLKITGINKDRLMKMNGDKEATANVLFNMGKNGSIYIKKGVEDKWKKFESKSPCFYLKVQ